MAANPPESRQSQTASGPPDGGPGIEGKRLGLRGRLFAAVAVLIVLLPLLILGLTYSLRKDLAPRLVAEQVEVSLRHCYGLRHRIELILRASHRLWFPGVPLNARGTKSASLLMYQQERVALSSEVRQWLSQIDPIDDIVESVRLVDNRGQTVARAGPASAGSRGGILRHAKLVQEQPGEKLTELLARVVDEMDPASGGGQGAAQSVFLPVRLGDRYVGGLYFDLSTRRVAARVEHLVVEGTQRRLMMSLFGTAFLALVAAYIVHLNKETRVLQSRLDQEKQMSSVGRLAAGLAHEVRTPLNALKMNLQMLQDRLVGPAFSQPIDQQPVGTVSEQPLPSEDAEYIRRRLDYICREATRLEVSVDDFLALARPAAPQKVPADINEALDELIEFVRPQCNSEGIEIARNFDKSVPRLSLDVAQIGQAMQNLIRNARQALNGARQPPATADSHGWDRRITISTRNVNGTVEIRVSDNGPGVSKADRAKIFDVFYTTKADGTGLGLCIVKRIVEQHDGEISVADAPGGGAEFIMRLGKKRTTN